MPNDRNGGGIIHNIIFSEYEILDQPTRKITLSSFFPTFSKLLKT